MIFFANIGPKLADSLPDADPENIYMFDDDDEAHGNIFEFTVTNVETVLKYVGNMSVYKSTGITNLGGRFLKDVFLYIPEILVDIFNKVLNTDAFPDSWKIATVIPLPKAENPKSPSELRPISLLPVIGKIMEKILHDQLKTFLENYDLLAPQQHGFRKNHSTQSANAKFIDDIMLHMDRGDGTVAVFLDINKAFNTINHKILSKKLQKMNIGQKSVSLLEDYLSNRKQRVLYKNIFSDELLLTTGVPQGSTLGPLLFLVYINDLPKILLNSNCLLFADDTVLYLGNRDRNKVYDDLQTDLDAVNAWCNNNQITLNHTKTEYLNFSYRKNPGFPIIPLTLGEHSISKADSYKYLGTSIDYKLNCHAQYNNIIQKLSFKRITFSKIRYLLNTETALFLYKACIQPLFDYNYFFYLLLSQNYCKKLQSMQYRFLRIVFKDRQYNRDQLFANAGIEKLDVRRKVHLVGLMYKRSMNPDYMDDRQLITRQFDKKVLKIPDVELTKTFKSPVYLGSSLWNALPQNN